MNQFRDLLLILQIYNQMLFNIYKLSYIHYLPIKNQFFPMINWKQRYFLHLLYHSIQKIRFRLILKFNMNLKISLFLSLSLSIQISMIYPPPKFILFHLIILSDQI